MSKEKKVLGEKKRGKLKKGAKFDVDFLELATRLVAAGMSEKEVAYFIGCTERDVKGLKRKDPLFKKACEDGKDLALSYLIAQGLRAAAGYEYEEKNVKIKRKVVKVEDEEGKVTEEILEYPAETSTFTKFQPPNPNLLMFLVSNLSRQLGKDEDERWMSQQKIEVDENKNIKIKISGNVASEQIERLAGAFLERKVIDAKVTDASDAQNSGGPPKAIRGNSKTHNK